MKVTFMLRSSALIKLPPMAKLQNRTNSPNDTSTLSFPHSYPKTPISGEPHPKTITQTQQGYFSQQASSRHGTLARVKLPALDKAVSG